MTTALEDTPTKIDADIAFEIKGKDLKELISGVAISYPNQAIMSVTRHIIVEAFEDGLRLVATNLSSFASVMTEKVKVTTPGRVGLYGAQLLKMRSQIGDDVTVSVTTKDSVATFKTSEATWGLRLNDIKMFPEFPKLDQGPWDIDRFGFIDAVDRVSKAAATDLVRQSFMLVDIADQTMRASDGARYQQVYTPWWPKDLDVAIGSPAIPKLVQFFRKAELGAVALYMSDQYFGWVTEGATYVIAKPAAKFAMMDDLLLKPAIAGCTHKFKCKIADFSKALSRLNALEEVSVVRIEMQQGFFHVRTEDRMGNTAATTVPLIESGVSAGLTLMFNHKHLTDLLAMAGGEEVGEFYVGPDKKTKKLPLLYRGAGGVLGVVNQMRLT